MTTHATKRTSVIRSPMKRLLLAAMLGTFAVSGPAVAHDKHHGKAHQKAEKEYWKDRRKAEKRYYKAVKEEQKAYRKWARGQYIPVEYRNARYYVDDYRAYNLDAPPSGYRYVRPYQDDNTYYLVQIATGVISQIFGR
jgi:Ni/Co efflux regulator RcnB